MARGRKRSRSVSGSGSGSGAAERPSKTTRRGSSNSGDGGDGGDGTPLSPGQGSDAAAVKKFYSDVARAILRFSTGMAEDFPDADKETLLDAVKAVLTDGIRDGLLDHEAGASSAIGSPLYLAAKLNLPDVAEFLLSVGASMVAPSMGTTPLDIACSEGNKEVLAELSSRLSELQNEYRSVHTPTKYGTSRVDPSWRSPGVYVSPSPNTRKLEVLEGLDQDRWDENNMALGFRALAGCVATYEGGENTQRLSDLETLLARGADPNFTSEEVRNVKPPLHVAASLDVFDIADTLLEAGAHLAASWKGSNAYAVAVAEGNSRVLSVFRAHVAAWEQSFGH